MVKDDPNLFACYVTNFSCAPDTFILHYLRWISNTKPFLVLELDSHTADAGVDTRIEAFLDIIDGYRRAAGDRRADDGRARLGRAHRRARTPTSCNRHTGERRRLERPAGEAHLAVDGRLRDRAGRERRATRRHRLGRAAARRRAHRGAGARGGQRQGVHPGAAGARRVPRVLRQRPDRPEPRLPAVHAADDRALPHRPVRDLLPEPLPGAGLPERGGALAQLRQQLLRARRRRRTSATWVVARHRRLHARHRDRAAGAGRSTGQARSGRSTAIEQGDGGRGRPAARRRCSRACPEWARAAGGASR